MVINNNPNSTETRIWIFCLFQHNFLSLKAKQRNKPQQQTIITPSE